MMTDAAIKAILEKVDPKSQDGKAILDLVKDLQAAKDRIAILEQNRDPQLWNEAIESAAKEIDLLARNVGANIFLSQAAAQAYQVAAETVRKQKK
jgi:hypothetical protein